MTMTNFRYVERNTPDAVYPAASFRGSLVDRIQRNIEGENILLRHGLLDLTHSLRQQFDKYLFKQYALRDEAVRCIKTGDIDGALVYLEMIGD